MLYQVNVTRDCNLRCTHCYISTKKKEESDTMTEARFLEVIGKIRDHLIQDYHGERVYEFADIHVIGGEPVMLGTAFFEAVMPQAKAILAEVPQNISFSIVTNLIDRDTMAVVPMFDSACTSFEVGTRFPKQKLQNLWERRVRELIDQGLDLTVTGAITRDTIECGVAPLMDYFTDLGFRGIHMGFFIPSGDGKIFEKFVMPAHEETSQYLIDLTDWYLANRGRFERLAINPIESMIRGIRDNEPQDDIVCPIIPGSLDFDADGGTTTCIEANGEVEVDQIGNIFEESIADILGSEGYRRARLQAVSPKRICRSCEEYTVCQAACSVLHGQWDGAGECPGFKRWIKYLRNRVETEDVRPTYQASEDLQALRVAGC